MSEVSIIGLDLAKNVFQTRGADASGAVIFRKKLRCDCVLKFLAAQPACTVAMEACASSHYWAREIAKLGHEIRLITPDYMKPFVKRQKNDATDAEAICEVRSGRLCVSWRLRARSSRRPPLCFAPAIFWCVSELKPSMRYAAKSSTPVDSLEFPIED